MIPLDASSANFPPYYLIINLLWLWEGEVKLTHSELRNCTVLQGDEKSSIFCTFYILGMSAWVTRKSGFWRAILLAAFLRAKPLGSDAFILVKRSLPGGSGEVGPPVSVLLCYEYGTDGAKSICSVGTKTLTTQLSLLKTLLSSFIPSAFCALLWGFDFIEKGTS